MARIVLTEPERCNDWLFERISVDCSLRDSYVIGLEKAGELVAAVAYTNFTGKSVVMHVAIDDCSTITRRFVWTCFDYPFNQMGVFKVLGYVDSSNTEAMNLDLKLGFRIVTVIPEVYPEGDLVVLEMKRGDCRWLKLGVKYGQESQSAAAA